MTNEKCIHCGSVEDSELKCEHCNTYRDEPMTNENKTERNEKQDIEKLLSMMNDGHLFRKYVENHLAKDFLFDLMQGLENTRPNASEGVDVEATVKELKEAIQQDRVHRESLTGLDKREIRGYNRAILMIHDFASEIISSNMKTRTYSRIKEVVGLVDGMIQQHNTLLNPVPFAIMAIKNVVEELTKIKTTLEGE
jgi:hypothetical protein